MGPEDVSDLETEEKIRPHCLILIKDAEDVVIRNIKMLNDIRVSNTDGFDPDASRGVFIENCFACCGDDNVAVKSTNTMGYLQDVQDITVKGNVFLTKKSALKVGTESNADVMKNIIFEDNDVLEAEGGEQIRGDEADFDKGLLL